MDHAEDSSRVTPDLDGALAAFALAVGAANVCTAADELVAAQCATFATTQRIPAIVSPQNRQEVQACLRIANQFRVPVYPTSTGKNWGYGSRVPVRSGSVLLSLRRLDRIVTFDERLAYVTLEPGVTFQMLHTFLRQQQSQRILWGTGSSAQTSIIGNTLERGLGRGPAADRWQRVCALEVVLPTGECATTGFARYPGARAPALHRAGDGPALDGLFTQSNLGVVTQMTVWLDTAPAVCQRAAFVLRSPAQLEDAINALRELLLPETLRLSMSLINPERIRAVNRPYPGISWLGEGVLSSSSPAAAQAEQQTMAAALGPHVDRLWFEPRPAHPELLGEDALAPAYAAKPRGATERSANPDPDRDRCGLLVFAPVLPFDGAAVSEALRLLEEVAAPRGFQPGVSLRCITPRVLYLVGSLVYDRNVPGEDERAAACHHALHTRLAAAGFFPYRLGLADQATPLPCQDDSAALLQSIKQLVDPSDILAPGRYDFRSGWRGEK